MNEKLRNTRNLQPNTPDSFHPTKPKKCKGDQKPYVEAGRLRLALVDAIDENEILRERVVEL
jgi:hypothetical protein